jgi:hypothetical protein
MAAKGSLEKRVANGLVEEVVQELTDRLIQEGHTDLAHAFLDQALKLVDPSPVAHILRLPLSGEEMTRKVHDAVKAVITDVVTNLTTKRGGGADLNRVYPTAQAVLEETVYPALGECKVKKTSRSYADLYGWLGYVYKRYTEERRWRKRWMWITIALGLCIGVLAGVGVKWIIFPFQGDLNERLLGSLVLPFALTIEAGFLIIAVEKIGKYQFNDKESLINSWAMPLLINAKAVYVWTGLNPAFWEDPRVRFLLRDSLKRETQIRIWTEDPGQIQDESRRLKAKELIEGLRKLSSTGDLKVIPLRKPEVPDYPHFVLIDVRRWYGWLPHLSRRVTIHAKHAPWWESPSPDDWPYGPRYEMYTFNPLLSTYLRRKVSSFPVAHSQEASFE